MSTGQPVVQAENRPDTAPEICRNCGAELVGDYCHCCGQQARGSISTIKGMFLEYLNNAFMWDPLYLRGLWNLVCRPGFLTSEFLSGRIVSHVHPLKLNMFILFVFMTLFVICSDTDQAASYGEQLTTDERFVSEYSVQYVMGNAEFVEKLKTSPRDTVQLYAPLRLATKYADVFVPVEVIEDTHYEAIDRWVASLPRSLIDDEILIAGEDGFYYVNTEVEGLRKDLMAFAVVWDEASDLMSRYFPMIVLLTAPFLAFSLRLVQRKQRLPFVNHFIFSLHYISFLELLILVLYALYLVAEPPMDLLQWIFFITPLLYLTIAFRRCYQVRSWFRALHKALWTGIIYGLILLFLLFVIVFAACVAVVDQL